MRIFVRQGLTGSGVGKLAISRWVSGVKHGDFLGAEMGVALAGCLPIPKKRNRIVCVDPESSMKKLFAQCFMAKAGLFFLLLNPLTPSQPSG